MSGAAQLADGSAALFACVDTACRQPCAAGRGGGGRTSRLVLEAHEVDLPAGRVTLRLPPHAVHPEMSSAPGSAGSGAHGDGDGGGASGGDCCSGSSSSGPGDGGGGGGGSGGGGVGCAAGCFVYLHLFLAALTPPPPPSSSHVATESAPDPGTTSLHPPAGTGGGEGLGRQGDGGGAGAVAAADWLGSAALVLLPSAAASELCRLWQRMVDEVRRGDEASAPPPPPPWQPTDAGHFPHGHHPPDATAVTATAAGGAGRGGGGGDTLSFEEACATAYQASMRPLLEDLAVGLRLPGASAAVWGGGAAAGAGPWTPEGLAGAGAQQPAASAPATAVATEGGPAPPHPASPRDSLAEVGGE
ncbi:hypothetical protein GPECTOR_236g552 [Gonium pectorale]|uniref:Uncharacterized protein n=1 Tax=Gonium pectorale TaxID=33097 RepID=A0A150FWJ1_GONPE|nr:hypothetical protein GPECTOR_236g552 [Gonium pectorale]|eukprot:KXZ41948.1 hypothetical protein GPECTOR_236g552 [Gonium pectorale]